AVVDPADDHRLVGVALEEADQHLVADPRHGVHAVAAPGPGLAHAEEARALLVAPALAVPVELHAHAAELVGVDLLPRGADDERALHAHDPRLRGDHRLFVW